jgi:P4 family phage/plasmid primase-like protien
LKNDLLDDLFDGAEVINIRAFGGRWSGSQNHKFTDQDAIERDVQTALDNGSNAGFGVAVRRDIDGGGGASNLLYSRALWVDIDDPGISDEVVLQRAEASGYPRPNYTVVTGGGVHLYWILKTPTPLNTPFHRKNFSGRLRLLAEAFEGDAQCAEPARIMRMPGTPNMKPEYNEGVRPECHISRCWAGGDHLLSAFPGIATERVIEGGRNNAMFLEAVRQRGLGIPEDAAYAAVWALNETACRPPLEDHEIQTTVRSAYSRQETVDRQEQTDESEGSGELPEAIEREIAIDFIRERGDSLRYEPGMGWMCYNGKFWERDEARALNMIGTYMNDLRLRARDAGDERLLRLCSRSLTYRKIKDMLSLAGTVPECWIASDDFDKDGMKVNFQNCTVTYAEDGRRTVGMHDREDYLTNALPSDYSTESEDPIMFLRFLDQIFDGDDELVTYLQKRLGSCLLGGVGDSKALIMYGDGANGKTVLAGILQECLGEYCYPVPGSTLTSGDSGETKVASLQGKRMGLVHEFGSSTQLNDERFKMLTGGEALISGRHLYGRHFSFRPVTSFVIMSNYLPSVNDMTHGLWRRMALIHFPVVIPEHEQDRGLMRRIVDKEADGIVKWLAEGTTGYLSEGLEEPESCRVALQEYKEGEDVLTTFLEEKYEPFTEGRVPLNDVFLEFNKWLKNQGCGGAYSKVNFGRLCHGRMIGGVGDSGKRVRVEKKKIGGVVYLANLANKVSEVSWA